MKTVLVYLDHWKLTVQKRAGPFTPAERKQMMLSDITQNGMRITGTPMCTVISVTIFLKYFIQCIHFWN